MFDTFIIDSKEAFEDLKLYVKESKFEYCVIDTETDGKNEKTARLHGIGFCFKDGEAFYIPTRNNERVLVWDSVVFADINSWTQLVCATHKVIGHNIIYDTLVLENNLGFDISSHIYSDTILQKHMLDEERPFGLKEVAVKYLGEWADKAQAALYENIKKNGGTTTKENLEMWKADTDVLAEYCCWDVILTRKLFDLFEAKLKEEELCDLFYKDEVMPLYREVTIDMKRRGFCVDVVYFQELKATITSDIDDLEDEIMTMVPVKEFEDAILQRDYPVKRAGNFPKTLARVLGVKLPEKDGKITLAQKALEKAYATCEKTEEQKQFYSWMLAECDLNPELATRTQRESFFTDEGVDGRRYIFNLKSNAHLGWLIFTHLQEKPLSRTETGKPQCDDDYLETLKDEYDWVAKLVDFKKLMKLSSTYVDGILDRQIDGVIYTSMLQFGTVSGRYSSTSPNLQNLPRPKGEDSNLTPMVLHYTNAIRAGFVAPKGWKIVDADYSALEPRCFSHMSADFNLQAIFHKGEDMYSSIAKRVFGLDGSVFKKDSHFIGKLYPEKRQIIKALALAVTYGAEAGRISQLLKIPKEEAQQVIDDYLDAYPGLKNYIKESHAQAKREGYVRTIFGRVRHLPHVKALYKQYGDKLLDYRYANKNGLKDLRGKYKNGLNNACNVRIQGLAAHTINRASIAVVREFKKENINGYVGLQIHDQLICVVVVEQAEKARTILKRCMENSVKLAVPLIAEPNIADNLKDSH